MDISRTRAAALLSWARRRFTANVLRNPQSSAVTGLGHEAARTAPIGCRQADHRRRRVDVLYALGLLASLAGFALIGKDVVAVGTGAGKPVDSRPAEVSPGPSAIPLPSTQKIRTEASRGSPPRSGSFPAPRQPKAWAEAMVKCARPGPRVQRFVQSFAGTPSQRIAEIYLWIAGHLEYAADQDQDWLTPAETLLEPGMLRGDCKAVALLLAAASAELGIANRMVATRGLGTAAGHVQTQLLLCRPGEDPRPIVDTMAAVWNQLGPTTNDGKAEFPLVLTSEGWYLALDGGPPPKRVKGLGPVEVIVSSSGRTDR